MTDVSVADLRMADILLTAGNGRVSKTIRTGTGSRYSHAILYVGDGYIVEAIGEGVVKRQIEKAVEEATLISVYRHKSLSTTQAQAVTRYALRQEAAKKKYDAVGAMGAGGGAPTAKVIGLMFGGVGAIATGAMRGADFYNRMSPETAFYCSELVALAYEKAGAPLVHKPFLEFGESAASTYPGEIGKSHVLELKGQLKVPAP